MKKNLTFILIVALSIAVGVIGTYLVFFDGEDAVDLAAAKTVRGTRVVKTVSKGDVKKIKEISIVEKPNGGRAVRIVETSQVRPGAGAESQAEDVDEENLTEPQKAVLQELQNALDENDLKGVRKALSKFVAKAEKGGLGGRVPVCMRSRAVAALGWFGKDAAVDLLEYVADSNEEVAGDAFVQFEQALSDCEMADRDRSQILTAAMTALTDGDQVDSLMSQLCDMRNSVKVQTAREILTTGSEQAKTQLLEDIEMYFDEGVKDIATLEQWAAENPDDPDDGELYGGEK